MKVRITGTVKLAALAIIVAVALQPVAVSAHQSPVTCNSSNLDLTLSKNRTIVRQGDIITYDVNISNVDNGSNAACDITGATVTLTLPAADGTATGTVITLATGVNYLAGTSLTFVGSANYTVNINPGITDIVAQARVTGSLHDAPIDHTARITKTVGTSLTQPHLSLTKAANTTNGTANEVITYTYQLVNDSTTNVPISSPAVNDDQCSPVVYASGDTNGNGIVDIGETWTFTCQKIFTVAGVYTNTATAQGTSTVDGGAVTSAPTTLSVRIRNGWPGLPKTGNAEPRNELRQHVTTTLPSWLKNNTWRISAIW